MTDPIEVMRSEFHFATFTEDGFEIVSQPGGEKSVISSIAGVYSLMNEAQNWLMQRQCKATLMEPDGRRHIWCELRADDDSHKENGGMHFGRRYDATSAYVMGHCYWADGDAGS